MGLNTTTQWNNRFPCHRVSTPIAVTSLKDCIGFDNEWDNSYGVGVPFTIPKNYKATSLTFSFTVQNYMPSTTLSQKTTWKAIILKTAYKTTVGSSTLNEMMADKNVLGEKKFTTPQLKGGGTNTATLTFSDLSLESGTYYIYFYDAKDGSWSSYHSLLYLTACSISKEICNLKGAIRICTSVNDSTQKGTWDKYSAYVCIEVDSSTKKGTWKRVIPYICTEVDSSTKKGIWKICY